MSEDQGASSVKPKPLLGILTSIAGIAAAFASFDFHLTNLEIFTYLLRAFLPEIIAILCFALAILFVRSKSFTLVLRHKLVSLFLLYLMASIAFSGIKAEMAEPSVERSQALILFDGSLSNMRVRFGHWRRLAQLRYSREQIDLFRVEMEHKAIAAFSEGDEVAARSFLSAASSVAGGFGSGADEAARGVSYLASRDRYLQNHEARIRYLEEATPLSSLQLYLMTMVQAMSPTIARHERLMGYMARLHAARDEAREAISSCYNGSTNIQLGPDATMFIARVDEMMGNGFALREGESATAWCQRVSAQAVVDKDVAKAVPYPDAFAAIAETAWGTLDLEGIARSTEEATDATTFEDTVNYQGRERQRSASLLDSQFPASSEV